MDQLIKIVRTYRVTSGVTERVQLAQEVVRAIEPDLRFFVLGFVSPPTADDIMQESIKAIVVGLKKFEGDSNKQFWAWCYRIARNKIYDSFRENERLQPTAPEELGQLLDKSVQRTPASPGVKHDLEYALKVLKQSKPECYEFLWQHYIFDLDYSEIAEERNVSYDSVRMKISRCLDEARKLVS